MPYVPRVSKQSLPRLPNEMRSLFHRGETYLSFLFNWGEDAAPRGRRCRIAVPREILHSRNSSVYFTGACPVELLHQEHPKGDSTGVHLEPISNND